MIRLGIIDDHPMVTSGLAAALGTIDDLKISARGGTFAEAGAVLRREDLDVVLLDVRLEDGNGIQALAERGHRDRPAVLVISSFMTSQYVAAASRFGAAGFLLKTVPLTSLVEAIRVVAAGGSVFTQEQLQKGFVTLRPRERQIVQLTKDGLSNKEIGARIGASAKTVESHLSDIYDRYGITGGRIELSRRAVEEGWLDIDPPVEVPRSPIGA